jgi:hypothetical protein
MTPGVDDCNSAYEALKERGAEFLTPPMTGVKRFGAVFETPMGT